MKTKDLLKTKLSSLAGPPLRQPRPLDERLRPARRQPDDHDDRDGRQSGIRLRRPQATVETFTQVPDYTVTFQADGATVKTMTVEDGYVLKDSDYPAVPTKTGYTGEWVKYTSAVHSNVTVQAKYTAVVTKYTVTFKADNTVVKTMTVKDGYTLKASDYPTVPAKSGYTGEWVKYTAAIHSDITINAVYEPSTVIKQYTVVFRADAKVLKTMKVEVGYTLQDSDYPEIPAKEGYTGHWDKSTTRIIKNTIINVIYSDNSSHVVTFIFDGAQIGTLTVTDGYVLKNSDYPSPFAPVGYIVTWEKYTLPIHSDITVTGKLQSDVTIPPQPTDPGEIMSGGEGEPVEADVPAEDETVSPQGTHVTGTQTVTHEYLTLNGKVARETIKTNNSLTAVLDFVYDESGKPFALKYSTNGTSFQTYYYVLNLQGDVVKLIHYIPGFEYESVATYEYDAWGNVSSSGRLAEINPLRYRGYYYDNETGFYYLQSRYYDPANRRFINADSYQSTGQGFVGTNMFAYCNNSPVDLYDPSGNAAGKSFLTVMEDCAGGRPRELDPNGIYQYAPNGTEALLLYESPYDSRANLTRKVTYLSPTQTREYVENLAYSNFIGTSSPEKMLGGIAGSYLLNYTDKLLTPAQGATLTAAIIWMQTYQHSAESIRARQMIEIMNSGTGMVIVNFTIYGTQCVAYLPWDSNSRGGDYGIYPYARIG